MMGSWGVGAFFVISGFVLGLPGKAPPVKLWPRLDFVFDKWLRLAPAYLLAHAMNLLVAFTFAATNELEQRGDVIRSLAWSHSFKMPLGTIANLLMVQLWAAPLCPMFIGPLWFVSTLFGCLVLYALVASPLELLLSRVPRYPLLMPLACMLGFCLVDMAVSRARSNPKLLLQLHEDLFQSIFDMTESETWSAHDDMSNPEKLGAWLKFFPPCQLPKLLAGACTARLVNQIPPDGTVRTWLGWAAADSLLVIIWAKLLYREVLPVKGWPLFGATIATTPVTCAFLFVAMAHPSPLGLVRTLRRLANGICRAAGGSLGGGGGILGTSGSDEMDNKETWRGVVLRILEHPALSTLGGFAFATYALQTPLQNYMSLCATRSFPNSLALHLAVAPCEFVFDGLSRAFCPLSLFLSPQFWNQVY